MRLDPAMSRTRLGSVCALLLLACSPATGGLGTFGGVDDSESGEADSNSGESGDEDATTVDTNSTGDGDPTSGGDGDGDPGDGDPGPMGECGNGIIEEGEDCEGEDYGGVTCMDYGFAGGDMGCTGSCMHDITKCWNESCGNGVADRGEDCDGTIPGDSDDCLQYQRGPGVVTCNQDCSFNFSDCGIDGEGDICGQFLPCPNNQLYCHLWECWDGSYDDGCSEDDQCLSGTCNNKPLGHCN